MPNVNVSENVTNVQNWLEKGWASITLAKVASFVGLALLCYVAAKLVMRLTGRLLERSSMEPRVRRTVLRGVRTGLYAVVAVTLLDSVGFPMTSLVAVVGVFGLAISLAAQDVLSNVAGGMVVLFSKPFGLGDYISTGDSEGTVEEIGLTHIKLDTAQGQRIMLPNSMVVDGKIVNYSTRKTRRVDHIVSASYDDPTEKVRAACLQAVEDTLGALQDPAPVVLVSEYGESAISYVVRFWTNTEDYWPAHAASLEAIRNRFDEAGVTMTYNHLNVHILDQTRE